jgi:DNA repair exonuclease SbcCD ATPase subunit
MKITKLEDITEESVKVLEASAVSDFIQEQLRTASEQFSTDKKRFSTELNQANEKHEALEKEHAEVKERLDKVQATLHTLEAEKAAKEAEEKFTQRMSTMDEEFVLEDAERELIASDIKDMGEEDFSAYQEKLNVLMKHRSREVIEANERQKAEEEAKATEAVKTEEVVEASAEDVVEEAIENAEPQGDDLPNSIEASEPTIYEKYKAAFAVDQFNIK